MISCVHRAQYEGLTCVPAQPAGRLSVGLPGDEFGEHAAPVDCRLKPFGQVPTSREDE